MVTTTINRLSLAWILVILLSPCVVPKTVKSKEELTESWLTRCFLDGYNAANSSSATCETIGLTPSLLKVEELINQCKGYFQLGCDLSLRSFFCAEGVSRVLSNDQVNDKYPCAEIDIAKDTANFAFECCTTCKNGYLQGSLNAKCSIFSLSNMVEQAYHRCCRAASTRTTDALDSVTTVDPSLFPSSENLTFDEISMIMKANDHKISQSLTNRIMNSSGVTPPIVMDLNNSSEESVTPVLVTSTPTPESSSSTAQPSSSTSDSNRIELPTSTEPSTSTSPSTTTSVSESTTETPSVESASISAEALALLAASPRSSSMNMYPDIRSCDGKCGENEKCFNLKYGHKCCPKGTEVKDGESECTYIDYCARQPCYQSEDDQHYCVDYFTGRLCEDKLVEGYRFVKGNEGVMELIDKNNSLSPRYLELNQKEVTLDTNFLQSYGLINLKLPKGIDCEWDFEHTAYAPLKGDALQDDHLTAQSKSNVYQVWVSGVINPQSLVASVTCNVRSKMFYRNTIYFTFIPKGRIYKTNSG